MLFVAGKNLFESPVRLLISVFGVGLAVMLILVMWAILEGTLSQAGALVRNTDARVWIVQKGFTDMAHGFSVLPRSLEARLERVPGVERANPITFAASELRVGGEKETLAVIGYDTRTGVGGPWAFATEPRTPERGELVVDETFAETTGVGVGDELRLPDGRRRRIVALSAGTNQFTNQLAFADIRDVRGLVRLRDAVNFYALQIEGAGIERVVSEVEERIGGVSAFGKPEFVSNNEREIRDGFQPILYVMVGIAFFVGLAVVGLTIYTATVEKSREYGVMAAIGAGSRQLNGVILRQAAIASALGFVVGTALLPLAGLAIGELAPKTELEYPPLLFAIVAAAAVAMALLASYIPVRRIARLDPAAVFRA